MRGYNYINKDGFEPIINNGGQQAAEAIEVFGIKRVDKKSEAEHSKHQHPVMWPLSHLSIPLPGSGTIITNHGPVFVEGPMRASTLHGYHLDASLSKFRTPEQQKKALEEIAELPDGYVYIARHGKTIIGYVTFLPPEPYMCWGNDIVPGLMELGVIEVSPEWRRKGVGLGLLRETFKNDKFEDYLIISMEFAWHWDTTNTGLSTWQYRQMLIDVLGQFGFELWHTNDVDILSHPANTFMVRIGKRVPDDRIERLKNLCLSKAG